MAVTSRWTVLPVLVVAATYAVVGPGPWLALAFGVGAAGAALLRRRLDATGGAQLLLGALLLAAGIAVTTSVFPSPEFPPFGMLRQGWSSSVAALLGIAVGRLYLTAPLGGEMVTVAIAALALAACGGSVAGPVFPAAVVAFLLAAAYARRAADAGRAPLRALRGRAVVVLTLAVGLAVGSAFGATIVLPEAQTWLVRKIMQGAGERTGFSSTIQLGSLPGLELSDERVLRVRGTPTDYLRGAVFSRYRAGRWTSGHDDPVVMTPLRRAPEGPGSWTEVEVVARPAERYFVPLDAVDVAVATGMAGVGRAGQLAPSAAEPAERYWFRAGHADAVTERPRESDRALDPAIGARLAPMAVAWTATSRTELDKLMAVEQRLRGDYRYSLRFKRSGTMDPVLDFLTVGREGHCEYFAAAMVLLARSIGIPARLVAGYRVVEHSELGGYYLVRERNAHAWVEAWITGMGWQRFDPTPPAGIAEDMPTATPLTAALLDWTSAAWAAGLRWLDQRTPLEISGALLLLTLGVLALRAVRSLRPSRKPVVRSDELPLPCFVALSAALARHGVSRLDHEPVEALARRAVEVELPAPLSARLAELVHRYAAHRYGALGERAALERAIDVAVIELGKLPARPPRP